MKNELNEGKVGIPRRGKWYTLKYKDEQGYERTERVRYNGNDDFSFASGAWGTLEFKNGKWNTTDFRLKGVKDADLYE